MGPCARLGQGPCWERQSNTEHGKGLNTDLTLKAFLLPTLRIAHKIGEGLKQRPISLRYVNTLQSQ